MNRIQYCVQCTDRISGKVGCFAYDIAAEANGEGFKAISEVFPSLTEFYDWADSQGYISPRNLKFEMVKP